MEHETPYLEELRKYNQVVRKKHIRHKKSYIFTEYICESVLFYFKGNLMQETQIWIYKCKTFFDLFRIACLKILNSPK